MLAERKVTIRAEVGEFMLLPVPPQELDWVQFRGVGRELLDDQPARLPLQVLPDQPAAVAGEAVPDDQQSPPQMAREVLQEIDNLWAPHRSGIEAEVEVPPRNPGDGRQRLPVEVILQDRGLPSRRPGPHPVRAFAEPTLVYEDDRSALPRGVFLSAGQRFSFQRRIACSSRSTARPIGLCTLQPRSRRMRHT